jgi:peptidoglycan/LPS O-acetylase OafA/YrhL
MIPIKKLGFNELHSHWLRGSLEVSIWIVAPLLVTWAFAELSNRFFERPFLRLKMRLEAIDSQPHETIDEPSVAPR